MVLNETEKWLECRGAEVSCLSGKFFVTEYLRSSQPCTKGEVNLPIPPMRQASCVIAQGHHRMLIGPEKEEEERIDRENSWIPRALCPRGVDIGCVW
jgi:hypothetical protein